MARTTTGVDVGSRSNAFLRGQFKGNTFHATDFAFCEHQADDVLGAWQASDPGFKPLQARVGLTGRNLNVRYTRVPRVPDWQLRKLMRFEVEEVGDQSGAEVASDFNVLPPLPEIEGEDVVLLGMARESLLDDHSEGLESVGGKLEAFTPNALALYNAWLRFGVIQEETVLIANIGHENLDVVVVRGPDLLFARNLSGGSKLFDDSIAQRFATSPQKAEEVKKRWANLESNVQFSDPNAEKASRAAQAAAGQLLSLLQSAVMFCKTQIKLSSLRLDKVALCGGGALLPGLVRYVQNGMSVPVELFDPFRVVETKGLAPELAEELDQRRLQCVIALGLATMASDADSYSIEILPEKVRKRREFWSGTAVAVASGILALGYLGYDAYRGSQVKEKVAKDLQNKSTRLRREERVNNDTVKLLERNKETYELALELQNLAGGGEQVARSLNGLYETLPELFWLNHMGADLRVSDALGIETGEQRPVVHLEGRAQEGAATVAEEYSQFLARLREKLPGAEISETLDMARNQFTIDLSYFTPGLEAAALEALYSNDGDADESDAEAEGEG